MKSLESMLYMTNEKRLKKILQALRVKSGYQLAAKLNCSEPQVSRWRNLGFARSTQMLVDNLLFTIEELKRENRKLRKELREYKKSSR